MRRAVLIGTAVVVGAALAGPPVAQATYAGRPGRIAYASAQPRDPANGDYSGVFDLYTRRRDGSGIRRLTRTPEYSDRDPSWSPSGRKIVWSCRGRYTETDPPYVADICLMDADGSDKVRFGFEESVASPEFSPDGKRIAYVTDGPEPTAPGGVPGGVPTDEVWIMDRDGSGRTQVTTNTLSETAITWSPDGTEIAFVSWDDSGDATALHVVDVATGDARLLAEGVEARPLYRGLRTSYVDWSPDGEHILFLRSDDDGDGSIDIYVVDPQGTSETKLTDDVGEYELSPAWAPHGRAIVFRHSAEGTHPETGADPSCIISFPRRQARPVEHGRDCPLHSVVEHDYAWQPRPSR